MATLRELRLDLGWTVTKLAKEANITRQAIASAEKGSPMRANTAKSMANALSRAYGRDIKPYEIENLNIL